METLQDHLGCDEDRYDEVKKQIEEICPMNKVCPLKSFPELCGYFRRLMREVFKPEQND